MKKIFLRFSWLLVGLLFTILWSSASTATKIGLASAEPLTIALTRFSIAALVMLVFAHLVLKYPFPKGKQWIILSVYGLLNISIYLGLYVFAMQHVTAGIGALAVATNPLFIGFISVFVLRKKLKINTVLALFLGTLGVVVASYPLLGHAGVSTKGLCLMLFSMLSYSVGSIYFNQKKWNNMSLLTINGWQTLLGGVFLLPILIFNYHSSKNHFDLKFFGAASWLAIFVSVFAVQCWLWLLKMDAVKASMWLFLTPISGFVIAAIVLKEQISLYTFIGVLLVLIALTLAQYRKKEKDILEEETKIIE